MASDINRFATLPEAVRLRDGINANELRADLDRLSRHAWDGQRSVMDAGVLTASAESGWRCLSLRSPGGDPARTDPGGPGVEEFSDTTWAQHAPHMMKLLATLPTELRSVRLMSLAPGTHVPEHRDTPSGFAHGLLRLHAPVTTNPGAVLRIDGVEHRWQPGALWYGDFSRPHSVINSGDTPRVHLIIDCVITPDLLRQFPIQVQDQLPHKDIAFSRQVAPLHPFQPRDFRCALAVPPCFLRLDEPVTERDEADLSARIVAKRGSLVLEIEQGPMIGLVHVGGGDFRLQGWIEERGLVLDLFGDAPRATYYTRHGRHRHRLTKAAHL